MSAWHTQGKPAKAKKKKKKKTGSTGNAGRGETIQPTTETSVVETSLEQKVTLEEKVNLEQKQVVEEEGPAPVKVVWGVIRDKKGIKPLHGSQGTKVQLVTNRMKLLSVPKTVSVFRFTYLNEKEGKKNLSKLNLGQLVDMDKHPIAYDGSKILVQYGVVSENCTDVHADDYVLKKLDNYINAEMNTRIISLDGREDMKLNISDEVELSQIHLQILEIILAKNLPTSNIVALPKPQQQRGRPDISSEYLDLRYRYRGNIVHSEAGPQLSLDVQGSVVYKKMSLVNFLKLKGFIRNNKLAGNLKRILGEIEGLKIVPNYRTATRPSVIKAFSEEVCGKVKTDEIDGTIYTVAQYFQQKLHINVNPNYHCVRTSKNKRIFYPIDAVDVVGEQSFKGEIPRSATKNVHLPPKERSKKVIQGFKQTQQIIGKSTSGEFKIDPGLNLVKVTGREIGSTNVRKNQRFFKPKALKTWIVLVADNRSDKRDIDVAVKEFMAAGKKYGMSVAKPLKEPISVRHIADVEATVKKLNNKDLQLIWLIKTEQDKFLYNDVKRFSWIETGIPVQVSLSKHFRNAQQKQRNVQAYMANLLLKVNVKLGGSNFKFDKPIFGLPKKCLILGLDVSHGMLNQVENADTFNSTAAMVAFDPTTNGMRSAFLNQKGRHDVILKKNYKLLLEKLKINYEKYDSIIMFRDGVGESMFAEVEAKEYKALKKYTKKKMKITFLVFNKRHKTRFFKLGNSGYENPNSGTVVDSVVTNKHDFDFYLQAHRCGIGSAKLPHYIVLHDDHKFNADALQNVTNKLSSLYQRSFGPVSQTCAAYYAHILADKCRFLLDSKGSFPELNNKLLATSYMYFL